MLQVPVRDVCNMILRLLNISTDFFNSCQVERLIYDYIQFGQLSIKDCVNYKQCLSFPPILVSKLIPSADIPDILFMVM